MKHHHIAMPARHTAVCAMTSHNSYIPTCYEYLAKSHQMFPPLNPLYNRNIWRMRLICGVHVYHVCVCVEMTPPPTVSVLHCSPLKWIPPPPSPSWLPPSTVYVNGSNHWIVRQPGQANRIDQVCVTSSDCCHS